MPDYDLIIRNGNIIDGSGAPGRPGAVAIAGDRIEAVGEVTGTARREIDAHGLAVAPGFIDVHTHDDAAVVRDPRVDFKIMQGVTTDIAGNCGAGVAPANEAFRQFYPAGFAPILGESALSWTTTAEFFAAVDEAHPACNVAAYVPHGVVRYNVVGLSKEPPTDAELQQMRDLVDEGMRAGAIGMSTGLVYLPGSNAQTPEIIELAKVAARYGGIYTSHIRNEGDGLLAAVAEAITIGEAAGCPVQISHHKAGGPNVKGLTKDSLRFIAEARARGVAVDVDVYPYTASSSSLAAMFRLGRGPLFEVVPSIIASVKYEHEKYEGKYVADIARELGMSAGEAIEKILHDEENSPSVIMFIMDDEDVRRVVADEHAMIGSDGLPSEGKPHPRLYGTFPRTIEKYVREERLITLEDAVRKMTSLPARKHLLKDRGELRAGAFADVVIFNPETIADVATYAEPRQYPPASSTCWSTAPSPSTRAARPPRAPAACFAAPSCCRGAGFQPARRRDARSQPAADSADPARTTLWNSTRLCVPSQNGFDDEWPQRQSTKFSAPSWNSLPSTSMSLIGPVTRYGPLSRTLMVG